MAIHLDFFLFYFLFFVLDFSFDAPLKLDLGGGRGYFTHLFVFLFRLLCVLFFLNFVPFPPDENCSAAFEFVGRKHFYIRRPGPDSIDPSLPSLPLPPLHPSLHLQVTTTTPGDTISFQSFFDFISFFTFARQLREKGKSRSPSVPLRPVRSFFYRLCLSHFASQYFHEVSRSCLLFFLIPSFFL